MFLTCTTSIKNINAYTIKIQKTTRRQDIPNIIILKRISTPNRLINEKKSYPGQNKNISHKEKRGKGCKAETRVE